MLDRFPTELISLVIDATSPSVWQRKALIDSLSSVSKSYRFILRPLRESIVHVPKAAIIPTLRSWPAATRKVVVTVLAGPSRRFGPPEFFSLQDYARLLSLLPNVKCIHLQRAADHCVIDSYVYPRRMSFELTSSNPFRQCLSLCVLYSHWYFPPTIETARFKLRQLRLDFISGERGVGAFQGWGEGLEQFLTKQRLPCLREIRLSCHRLPKLSADFINQLDAAEFNFPAPVNIEQSLGGAQQIGPFATPVLFSFDMERFPEYQHWPCVRGIAFAHLQLWDVWDLNEIVQLLPDLKALSFEAWAPDLITSHRESLDRFFDSAETELVKDRPIEFFGAEAKDDQFVNAGFLDFLRSRGPRS